MEEARLRVPILAAGTRLSFPSPEKIVTRKTIVFFIKIYTLVRSLKIDNLISILKIMTRNLKAREFSPPFHITMMQVTMMQADLI
ncbi:hypothetical protein BST81_23275 [Leptolyngbya sp. 'hensonii']|nr:hypothetical protein BST81_23275 [Leptolyngbya sp. 'hensonii']